MPLGDLGNKKLAYQSKPILVMNHQTKTHESVLHLLAMLLHAGCFSSRQLALYWLLCALAISMLLYVGSEQIHIYVGLSGLLHAMLTLGALKDIQLKINTGWLLLAGLIVKVSWEQWHGPDEDLAKLINASVATDAHLYGVVSALALGLPAMLWLKTKKVQRR